MKIVIFTLLTIPLWLGQMAMADPFAVGRGTILIHSETAKADLLLLHKALEAPHLQTLVRVIDITESIPELASVRGFVLCSDGKSCEAARLRLAATPGVERAQLFPRRQGNPVAANIELTVTAKAAEELKALAAALQSPTAERLRAVGIQLSRAIYDTGMGTFVVAGDTEHCEAALARVCQFSDVLEAAWDISVSPTTEDEVHGSDNTIRGEIR